jgi:hypothetical protein
VRIVDYYHHRFVLLEVNGYWVWRRKDYSVLETTPFVVLMTERGISTTQDVELLLDISDYQLVLHV